MVVKPIILCVIVRKHKNHKIGYMKNEELRKCHIDINKKGSYIKIIKIGGCNIEKQRSKMIEYI